MLLDPRAGTPIPKNCWIDVTRLEADYYARTPDADTPAQRVAFRSGGHRGSSQRASFNEAHVLAIVQAICDFRADWNVTGPLFLARDTHGLSAHAYATTLTVLAANGVDVFIDRDDGYAPTPAVSHAILTHNRTRTSGVADGIVVTPSDNPPEDGGLTYSSSLGGPADLAARRWIEQRANELLGRPGDVPTVPYDQARRKSTTHPYDYAGSYVGDLESVVDVDAIRRAGLTIGVDPLGGASARYWHLIASTFGLKIHVINDVIDPAFRFMPLDWDGSVRMDCGSPYAMANLIRRRDRFDIGCGNDPDAGRHGIVTPASGLMRSHQYFAAAVAFLFTHRDGWPPEMGIGTTMVNSSVISRVAGTLRRPIFEVPVGFSGFVPGLVGGSLGFCGDDNAGASFVRRDGTLWSADRDGIVMNLLAAEIRATTGDAPSELYRKIVGDVGGTLYDRIDVLGTEDYQGVLADLTTQELDISTLAGEPITAVETLASGNGEPLGGVKVTSRNGWFAAHASGIDNGYILFAESSLGRHHLRHIQQDAQAALTRAFAASSAALVRA